MGEGRRQVGVGGIAEVDLDPQAADPRGGRVSLDEEIVGHGDRGGHLARSRPARRRDRLGQVAGVVTDGGRRAILTLAAEDVQTRVLIGVDRVAELVVDARAELERVGPAELLLREADLEVGRDLNALAADRHGLGLTGIDRDHRRDTQRPVAEHAGGPVLELVSWSVQTPGTHRPNRQFLMSTVLPSRLESGLAGWNVPVKGAVPR